ncbi:MAG: TMEM43 family protein, partial [Candidatus Parabeggiatoa sp.]|nr:TMEM43 family protein [Candidatus Parabeggiatoa sp.]
MKYCPGVWCPSTIFFAAGLFFFYSFFGLFLCFISLNLIVNIPIHDIGDVTSIKADHIDESNEGKRVHLTGDITTDDFATDPLFGVIVSNVIILRRVVEKFDGQGWSNTTSPLNQTFVPKQVKLGAFKLGAFTLSSDLVDKMGAFTLSSDLVDKMPYSQLPMTLELFEQIPDNLSIQLGGKFGKLHFYNGNYYVGQEPAKPQFGDLRISFLMVSTETVSVIAKQVGSGLVSYRTHTYLLKSGVASLEEIISGHKNISVK